jgi:hypothetical protein
MRAFEHRLGLAFGSWKLTAWMTHRSLIIWKGVLGPRTKFIFCYIEWTTLGETVRMPLKGFKEKICSDKVFACLCEEGLLISLDNVTSVCLHSPFLFFPFVSLLLPSSLYLHVLYRHNCNARASSANYVRVFHSTNTRQDETLSSKQTPE